MARGVVLYSSVLEIGFRGHTIEHFFSQEDIARSVRTVLARSDQSLMAGK